MRDIKFRAWNGREMLRQPLCDTFRLHRFFGFVPVDAKIMQYTGLKDNKGAEIYEGDLFRCIYHRDGHSDHIYEVIYYEQGTRFQLKRHGNPCSQTYVHQSISDVSRYEVIGNVHENPELLKMPDNQPAKTIKLTSAQKRVLDILRKKKESGKDEGWVQPSELHCQSRVIHALFDMGLVERTTYFEYRIKEPNQ